MKDYPLSQYQQKTRSIRCNLLKQQLKYPFNMYIAAYQVVFDQYQMETLNFVCICKPITYNTDVLFLHRKEKKEKGKMWESNVTTSGFDPTYKCQFKRKCCSKSSRSLPSFRFWVYLYKKYVDICRRNPQLWIEV